MSLVGTGLLLAIVLWILFGALAGWIASSIMRVSEGFWGNVLIGIVGGLIGGILFSLLGIAHGGLIWSLISSVVGAVILLAIVRAVRRPVMTP